MEEAEGLEKGEDRPGVVTASRGLLRRVRRSSPRPMSREATSSRAEPSGRPGQGPPAPGPDEPLPETSDLAEIGRRIDRAKNGGRSPSHHRGNLSAQQHVASRSTRRIIKAPNHPRPAGDAESGRAVERGDKEIIRESGTGGARLLGTHIDLGGLVSRRARSGSWRRKNFPYCLSVS